jgi:hypothetical protein
MSNFNGRPYLRVLTPRTSDGKNLLYDKDLRVRYKESHFELSALPALEKENLTRPVQLRHIIKKMGMPLDVQEVQQEVFVARPQRVKRVDPSIEVESVDGATITIEQAPKPIIKKEKKPEKAKRVRRTREQIEADKQAV